MGQIFNSKTGMTQSLQQEKPVGEIGIDQDVQSGELDEEGGVTDPGECEVRVMEFGKLGFLDGSGPAGQPGLPDHFMEEAGGIEVVRRGQLLERAGDPATPRRWAGRWQRIHGVFLSGFA